jgi:ferredoxin-type protein NapH
MYQWLRRLCLAATFATLLIVPIWHLGHRDIESAGLAGGGRWVDLADASRLSATPPALVGTPWSIGVLGVEFLDPLAGISLLVTGGRNVGILIALLPTFLLVVVLGRVFCGWLCPYVPILAVSDAIRELLAKLGVPPPDRRLDRGTPFVVLGCLMLLTALSGAVIAPLVYPPAVMGRQLFRVVFLGGLGAGVLVVAAAFAFDTFVSRAGFCKYLCPGGALFRLIGVASPVRLQRDPNACTSCGTCNRACNLAQSPMTDGLDSGCERCGKCVSACPNEALQMTLQEPRVVLLHPKERA